MGVFAKLLAWFRPAPEAVELVFRTRTSYPPRQHTAGVAHWQIEAWAVEDDQNFPAALAWVCCVGGVAPILDYVQVADQYRRRGVATALVEKIRRVWPTLRTTAAISPGGARLIAKLGLQE